MTVSISTDEITYDVSLAQLEEYANANRLEKFSQLAGTVAWANHTPEELLHIIDLALSLELTVLAKQLSQRGRDLFPNHEHMQQAACVLAPASVRRVKTPQVQYPGASQRWLRENATEYRGKWVAVRDGALVGAADTLAELKPVIGEDSEALNTLVTKVL